MKFSEKIKNLRLEHGLTQQQLSKHLGITASAIGFLENGQRDPTGSTLIAYAKFFDISIDILVGLEPDLEDKIYTPSSAPTLPTVERELLSDFRKLPADLQRRASTYMRRLVEVYEEENAATAPPSSAPKRKTVS